MATNYVQVGENITVAAPTGGVSSGDPVQINNLFGIALGDADEGDLCDLGTLGVWTLPKVSTDTFAVGEPCYFDATAGLITSDDDSGGNDRVGVAVAAAANPSGTVKVRLDGSI